MKYVRILFAVALAFVFCSAFTLKDKEKKEKAVYAFGVGASFNDSVVYFTEVQMLDSVELHDLFLREQKQTGKRSFKSAGKV